MLNPQQQIVGETDAAGKYLQRLFGRHPYMQKIIVCFVQLYENIRYGFLQTLNADRLPAQTSSTNQGESFNKYAGQKAHLAVRTPFAGSGKHRTQAQTSNILRTTAHWLFPGYRISSGRDFVNF